MGRFAELLQHHQMSATSTGRILFAAWALLASNEVFARPAAAQTGAPSLAWKPTVLRLEDVGIAPPVRPELGPPAFAYARARLDDDFVAMRSFRPGYPFWNHIFTIPDGAVAFGSAEDGRLLVSFPTRGDWSRSARWADPWLSGVIGGELARNVTQRRQQVASLLESSVGKVIHNETRGNFVLPNARRYGSFLSEWSAIYERFGVPGEIGLAQAVLESGLNGKVRSEAKALGFCQWLPQNWNRMKRLAHHVIEGYNQTSQAPYCAAYLTILATKYGSFIPALSEHHAGGTNVARTVIMGSWLGGQGARERYLLGSQLAYDLREISPTSYRDLYGTYGPRSFRYAEMVFGNTLNVKQLQASIPQERIYAMRTRRAVPLSEITRRTGLSADQVRRFNPALVSQVPARADLYLPMYVESFGEDVSFWQRPATAEYLAVLDEFLRLEASVAQWHDLSFRALLRDFQRRFEETRTEEGEIMATALAYFIEETYDARRREILNDYQNSGRIYSLFERGVSQRDLLMGSPVATFEPSIPAAMPD